MNYQDFGTNESEEAIENLIAEGLTDNVGQIALLVAGILNELFPIYSENAYDLESRACAGAANCLLRASAGHAIVRELSDTAINALGIMREKHFYQVIANDSEVAIVDNGAADPLAKAITFRDEVIMSNPLALNLMYLNKSEGIMWQEDETQDGASSIKIIGHSVFARPERLGKEDVAVSEMLIIGDTATDVIEELHQAFEERREQPNYPIREILIGKLTVPEFVIDVISG